jgi:hypothetical protein
MRRVHDYEEDPKDAIHCTPPDQPRRKKASAAPSSAAMKRTGSSAHSKVQVMSSAPPRQHGRTATQAQRYASPQTFYGQSDLVMTRPVSMADVQFSPVLAIPSASTDWHPYNAYYPS